MPTITIGIAVYRDGEPIDTMIHRADEALYRGKKAGRNRVVLSGPMLSTIQPLNTTRPSSVLSAA